MYVSGSNMEKAQNEENKPLIQRKSYVNSLPPFVILPKSNEIMNPNDPDRNHKEDIDSYPEKGEDESPQK